MKLPKEEIENECGYMWTPRCTSCGTTSREVVHGDGRDGLWPQVLAHDVKMDSIGSTDVNLAGLGIVSYVCLLGVWGCVHVFPSLGSCFR